mgnify:CR=1 FL=1
MQKIFDFHTHPFWDDASNICSHKDIVKMAKEDMRPMFENMGVAGIAGSVILRDDSLPLWEKIAACNDLKENGSEQLYAVTCFSDKDKFMSQTRGKEAKV